MKRSIPLVVLAASGLCASWSMAHPDPVMVKGVKLQPRQPASRLIRAVPTVPNVTDGVFSDSFEAYADGSSIIGQGGWEGWFGSVPPPDAFISTEQAATGTKSLRETSATGGGATESDIVRPHNITGGKWVYSAKYYIPSSSIGTAFFILLNTYPTFDWSCQVSMSMATNLVTTAELVTGEFPGGVNNQVPLIRDQWVPLRVEIDLDAGLTGRADVYYNNQLVTNGLSWNPGQVRMLQALDLYSQGADKFFVDDVKLEAAVAPCYPDCNGDLALNLADFGCFQTKFALGNIYADCNGDTVLNLADFGCFQTKFALGCP